MPQTTQELKNDIDTGQTGDRIDNGYDPGLSPLGTDDEAAGSPNTPEQVRLARALEGGGAAAQPAAQGANPTRRGFPALWVMVAAIVLVVAAVAAALL